MLGGRRPGQSAAGRFDDRFAGQQVLATMGRMQLEPALGRKDAKHLAARAGRIVDPPNRLPNRSVSIGGSSSTDQVPQPELPPGCASAHAVVVCTATLARPAAPQWARAVLAGSTNVFVNWRFASRTVPSAKPNAARSPRGSKAAAVGGVRQQRILPADQITVVGPKSKRAIRRPTGPSRAADLRRARRAARLRRPVEAADSCRDWTRGRPEQRQHDPDQKHANQRHGQIVPMPPAAISQRASPVGRSGRSSASFAGGVVPVKRLLIHKLATKAGDETVAAGR